MLVRNGGAQKLTVTRNQQWSVTALADSATGDVLERYAYDEFGKRTILEPDGSTVRPTSNYDMRYGYTSRCHDSDTGLMYFRARYYDPATGEFISQDPLEYVDGMSQYRAYFVPDGMDLSGNTCQVWYKCKLVGGSSSGLLGWRCHYACTEDKTKKRKPGATGTIGCNHPGIPKTFVDVSTKGCSRLPGDSCPATANITRIWDTWGKLTNCSQKACDKKAKAAAANGAKACKPLKGPAKIACKAYWKTWEQGAIQWCTNCKNP